MSSAGQSVGGQLRHRRELREAIEVWTPTFPRRAGQYQQEADSVNAVMNQMVGAHGTGPGYVSVYSFPRGHSSEGEVPRVDTLMFDFDLPGKVYQGDGNRALWRVEMDGLLAVVRRLVTHLVEEGLEANWRFSLSGHKGVHLYLDFEPVSHHHGNLQQFKRGLAEYAENLMEYLNDATGTDLDPWLDVDSTDMGRLTRMPNTLHTAATNAFGDDRYCVPVTASELMDLDPEGYEALVSRPRRLPDEIRRVPSQKAASRIATHVQTARGGNGSASDGASHVGNLTKDQIGGILADYDEDTSNPAYQTVNDIWLFVEDKPCIRAFYDRDDQFDYGNQSHVMELFVLTKLVNMDVPSDVMLAFFEEMDGFDEWATKRQLAQIILRHYSEFNCQKIWNDASRFCLENRCNIYRESH